jgi:hypothetical protein
VSFTNKHQKSRFIRLVVAIAVFVIFISKKNLLDAPVATLLQDTGQEATGGW